MTSKQSKITTIKKPESLAERLDLLANPNEKESVMANAKKKIAKDYLKDHSVIELGDIQYNVAALKEFEHGIILTMRLPDDMKTLAIDMYQNLIKDHHCENITEKMLARNIVMTYCRIEQLHQMEMNVLTRKEYNQLVINWGNFLSKELERANREYLTGIQSLKQLKMPPFQLTLKTDIANIAQNQVVTNQENNNVKPI